MTDSDKNEPPAEKPVTDAAQTIGGWMIALLWIIALGSGTFLAHQWLEARAQARQASIIDDGSGSRTLVLSSDRFGQYLVEANVKNNDVNNDVAFLLDTGASGISIPQRIADELGLQRGRPARVMTANGDITVYATSIDSLSIGPFTRTNVKAHINPQMDGELALLGMSFLRHYELIQRGGKLSISNP